MADGQQLTRPHSWRTGRDGRSFALVEHCAQNGIDDDKHGKLVKDPDVARKVLKLMKTLDDHDDVQSTSANLSIPNAATVQLEI